MTPLRHRKKAAPFAAAAFVLLALSTVLAMGDKPTPQQEALKLRCDELTKETGEPHFYGEGRITRLVDFVLPTHSEQNPRYKDYKSYIAVFDNFSYERTYIKATHARWKKIAQLKEGSRYAFCYTVAESKEYAAINHPETMLLLD